MLAFCWLDPSFDFTPFHFVYPPLLRCQRSDPTSLFQSHPAHLLLLHFCTLQLYIILVKTSCTNTNGFWTLAEFFTFYQRVRVTS